MTDKTPRLLACPLCGGTQVDAYYDDIRKIGYVACLGDFPKGSCSMTITVPSNEYREGIRLARAEWNRAVTALAHLSACGDAVAWAELCRAPNGSIYWQTSVPADQLPLGRYYPSPLPEPEVRELVEAAKALSKDHKHAMALIADSEVPVVSEVSKRVDTALSAPRLLDYLRGQQP